MRFALFWCVVYTASDRLVENILKTCWWNHPRALLKKTQRERKKKRVKEWGPTSCAFFTQWRCFSELDINIKKYNIIAFTSFIAHITVHTLVVVSLNFHPHLSLFIFASDYVGDSKTSLPTKNETKRTSASKQMPKRFGAVKWKTSQLFWCCARKCRKKWKTQQNHYNYLARVEILFGVWEEILWNWPCTQYFFFVFLTLVSFSIAASWW